MATFSIDDLGRRDILKLSALVGIASVVSTKFAFAQVPAGRTPLVLFIWGPTRITPVRLRSLTIRETSFDELLNPIHATADLGFGVLRTTDLAKDDTVARAAATFYQAAREVKAVLQLPQILELDA